jgi:hypothetical protein
MDDDAARAAPAQAASSAPPASMLDTLRALWSGLPGLVGGRVEILALELQRAGLALVQIVMLIVVVAVLGVTAWLLVWVGLVAAMVALGLQLPLALGVAWLLNLLAIWLAARRINALLALLKLPTTRRHLTTFPAARAARPAAAPASNDPVPADERHAHTNPGQSTAPAA